jgi:hypothetical protein
LLFVQSFFTELYYYCITGDTIRLRREYVSDSKKLGRRFFLSVLAEFERELTREQILYGLANAKEKDKSLGCLSAQSSWVKKGLLFLN